MANGFIKALDWLLTAPLGRLLDRAFASNRRTDELLKNLLTEAALPGLPQRDIDNAQSMLDYAEHATGFDIIVQQLYEYDVRITAPFYDLVRACAGNLNLEPEAYNFLRLLIDEQ